MQQLLVYGDPAQGFTFVGPIKPNDPDLENFTDVQLKHVDWWYCDMQTLEEAINS